MQGLGDCVGLYKVRVGLYFWVVVRCFHIAGYVGFRA